MIIKAYSAVITPMIKFNNTAWICPCINVHAHHRGVWLRPAFVILEETLLLEPEKPINVVSLLLSSNSHNISLDFDTKIITNDDKFRSVNNF